MTLHFGKEAAERVAYNCHLSAPAEAKLAEDWLALRGTLVRVLHEKANRGRFMVLHQGRGPVEVTHLNCDDDPALAEAFALLDWPNPVRVEDAR